MIALSALNITGTFFETLQCGAHLVTVKETRVERHGGIGALRGFNVMRTCAE